VLQRIVNRSLYRLSESKETNDILIAGSKSEDNYYKSPLTSLIGLVEMSGDRREQEDCAAFTGANRGKTIGWTAEGELSARQLCDSPLAGRAT
jgi:hypothetical protein